MEKKIRESKAFLVYVGKARGRIVFFVRHKSIKEGKVVPVNIEDLLSYLIKNQNKTKNN